MRRWWSIATCSLILLTVPVWAQHRGGGGHIGGGGGAHFASHGSFTGHASAVHASGGFRGGGFGRGSGMHGRTGNRFHHHHHGFDGRRGFYSNYPYASYYPYYPYGYYSYDDPFFYDTENEDQDSYAGPSYQAPSYPAPSPEDSGLRSDVQALSGKIDRLQADVEARNRPKGWNPRRRWFSATSMWKKCGITRSPAGRCGCSTTTKPGRRFHSRNSIFLPRPR